MTKKKQVIYLMPSNRYSFGSFMNNLSGNISDGKFTSGMFKDMNTGVGTAINAGASLLGGMAGSAIGGGMESGAGSVISGLGSVASAIPGPWGAIAGAGLNVVGGLVNRAFGSKLNQENINEVNSNINQMTSFNSDAGSFDALAENMKTQPSAMGFDQSFIGKDGWFSSKAKRKYNELKAKARNAQMWVDNSLANNTENLIESQGLNALANFAAFGGPLHSNGTDWNNGVIVVGNGGTHEQNPYDGIQMGIAPDGTPNLVEEGEVVYNDYVFSNRIKVPKAFKEKYKLKGADTMTFADAAKKVQKASEERPNDPISKRTLEDAMGNLMMEQEMLRQKKANRGNKFAEGGQFDGNVLKWYNGMTDDSYTNLVNSIYGGADKVPDAYKTDRQALLDYAYKGKPGKVYNGIKRAWDTNEAFSSPGTISGAMARLNNITPESLTGIPELTNLPKMDIVAPSQKGNTTKKGSYNPLTALRYAPALGAGIGVFSDLMGWTNKPDYSAADSLLGAAGAIGDVKYAPIGDYLKYTPLDRLFYANQLGAQAAGTRRGIMNSSGMNRGQAMAGLLAADYNAQEQLGKLFRQSEEYNLGQRERVATFNRGTNMFNAENDLKAQIASRDLSKIRIEAASKAAALRAAADERAGAARSANLTNLLDSLGNIGREEVSKSWINENPGLRYGISTGGRGVKYDPNNGTFIGAKGGFLTIKQKRRRK